MWGSIVTDINNNPNFNIQFPNTKSDVLIHLVLLLVVYCQLTEGYMALTPRSHRWNSW